MRTPLAVLSLGFAYVLAGCVTLHSPKLPVIPPSIVTTTLPTGTVGIAYTASVGAIDGIQPYSWSLAGGTLPAGLTLTGNIISGTPTASGTANFTVEVKDASHRKATANLSITINPAS